MSKKKKLIPLLAVAALGAGALAWSRWWKREDPNRILISGNIELTEINLAFKMSGKLVERAVGEGDAVKKGQLVAGLDQQQLLAQCDRIQAVIEAAQSRLAQLHTEVERQRQTVVAQIAYSRAQLEQAEARLRQLLAGSREQEIAQARAGLERAETEHDKAAKDWERAKALYDKQDISASDRDQFLARYDAARASLKQAKELLSLVVEGPRKEDIEGARAQVAQARAALALAEAARLDLRVREQQVPMRRAEIDQARAELAINRTQLEDAVIASPTDGVVLAESAEVGEILAAGTTVVTIGDLDHPWLRGYIGERDLGRVKLGARVRVTTDSFPRKVYRGRLSFISSKAEFTPKQIQTQEERVKLVYRVKIDIENPQRELKSNMPADAEILLNDPNR
ncbi:MAG: efflux RND transporter periplasmic adaptor subunit [Acidobacteriota bacterium]